MVASSAGKLRFAPCVRRRGRTSLHEIGSRRHHQAHDEDQQWAAQLFEHRTVGVSELGTHQRSPSSTFRPRLSRAKAMWSSSVRRLSARFDHEGDRECCARACALPKDPPVLRWLQEADTTWTRHTQTESAFPAFGLNCRPIQQFHSPRNRCGAQEFFGQHSLFRRCSFVSFGRLLAR
jgi:hypothetical protein